jgi:3-oxoadipate enol-lactonase
VVPNVLGPAPVIRCATLSLSGMPYANNDGTRIYWTEAGSGDPLLLIMGLGYSHQMWHRVTPVVSQHFRTILFDNRGVGQSDIPGGPYPIAVMAADAAAVLDAAGIQRAHVFGISMGGMIAQEFALQDPARVAKLILGCTACGGSKAVRAEPAVNTVLMNRSSMPQEEAIRAAIPYIYDPHTPAERIEEDLVIRRRTFPEARAYTAQLQGILAWNCYDRLPNIAAPTLVIHGETDRLVPPGNGKLIAETIPGAKFVLLPKASHIFTTDQPRPALSEIVSFLR